MERLRQGMAEHEDLVRDSAEEELIRAAQAGNREAFAQLYEAHVDQVFNYLRRRMGQPADAEDITAEVFISVMAALPSYQIKGAPFIAWLLRIAHNTAVNHMKKHARRRETELEETSSDANDPAELAINRVVSDEVAGAMNFLTDLQKEVITLRFMTQLTVAETAQQMDRSEGAVKFLQHSALQALRRILSRKETVSYEG
ncbi:MAG: RNA polymerase sigma factor [Dehalococcoidia bacterium]